MSLEAGDFSFRLDLWNRVEKEKRKIEIQKDKKEVESIFDEMRNILNRDVQKKKVEIKSIIVREVDEDIKAKKFSFNISEKKGTEVLNSVRKSLDALFDDDTVKIMVRREEDPKELEKFKDDFKRKVAKQPTRSLVYMYAVLKAGAITVISGVSLAVIVTITIIIAIELGKRDTEEEQRKKAK
jgi:hypothetical protein